LQPQVTSGKKRLHLPKTIPSGTSLLVRTVDRLADGKHNLWLPLPPRGERRQEHSLALPLVVLQSVLRLVLRLGLLAKANQSMRQQEPCLSFD
jgi:hypothetical protein